jgi:ubiquitin C-terminal hydrolase
MSRLHERWIRGRSKIPQNCSCIAHQSVSGRLYRTMTCYMCGNIISCIKPFNELSFNIGADPPPDFRYPKPKKITVQTKDLLSCLKDLTKVKWIEAEPEGSPTGFRCHSSFCNGMHSTVAQQLQIQKLPPTLCIHIESYRFENGMSQKVPGHFRFPSELDMSPYITNANKLNSSFPLYRSDPNPQQHTISPSLLLSQSPERWYDLFSIVVHKGCLTGGHYITYCKRDGIWLLFDDDRVTLATEKRVMDADPYLLFYLRRGLGEECG